MAHRIDKKNNIEWEMLNDKTHKHDTFSDSPLFMVKTNAKYLRSDKFIIAAFIFLCGFHVFWFFFYSFFFFIKCDLTNGKATIYGFHCAPFTTKYYSAVKATNTHTYTLPSSIHCHLNRNHWISIWWHYAFTVFSMQH